MGLCECIQNCPEFRPVAPSYKLSAPDCHNRPKPPAISKSIGTVAAVERSKQQWCDWQQHGALPPSLPGWSEAHRTATSPKRCACLRMELQASPSDCVCHSAVIIFCANLVHYGGRDQWSTRAWIAVQGASARVPVVGRARAPIPRFPWVSHVAHCRIWSRRRPPIHSAGSS